MTIPFCKDCAHLLGVRHKLEDAANWKCASEGNVITTSQHPVTGDLIRHFKWDNCFDVRQDKMSCGPEGKWFTLYEKPDYSKSSLNAPGKVSADVLLNELENLK